MKTSESQFSVIPVEEIDEALTSYSSGNHTSKSTANGSIITMTMKNNHLIVETEERVAVSYISHSFDGFVYRPNDAGDAAR